MVDHRHQQPQGQSSHPGHDRWIEAYSKLGGMLETPQRALYLLTTEGRRVLSLPEEEASLTLIRSSPTTNQTKPRQEPAGTRKCGLHPHGVQ